MFAKFEVGRNHRVTEKIVYSSYDNCVKARLA